MLYFTVLRDSTILQETIDSNVKIPQNFVILFFSGSNYWKETTSDEPASVAGKLTHESKIYYYLYVTVLCAQGEHSEIRLFSLFLEGGIGGGVGVKTGHLGGRDICYFEKLI